MTDIVERLRQGVDPGDITETEFAMDTGADEIKRLRKLTEWYDALDLKRIAEAEQLRAFAQYVADMAPGNPAPLFEKARRALEDKT